MGHLAADFTLKLGFESKKKAKAWIRSGRYLKRRDSLLAYKCGVCPNYHVGHKLPSGW